MPLFRRFTHRVETFLDDIHDYETGVVATLRDVERGSIRLRAQRLAAQRRLQATEQMRGAALQQERLWQGRALRAEAPREQALECVRRARLARQQALAYTERQRAQHHLVEQLVADEQTVESKLSELRQRRASLLSREVRAAAIGALEGDGAGQLETIFDRWQARIEAGEAQSPHAAEICDPLTHELRTQEEQASLEQELAAWLHAEANHDNA